MRRWKNKKGLPDLTLSLPSLQGNMGDNFAQSNRSSIGRGKMNEPDILTYPSVREVRGCSFCNENNWFRGDASPKPGPHCFLQYQAIHTGQSLSGVFWNGLVLSAKKFVIGIILFRDTARTLATHPSHTWCHNSSAERQKLAKNQSFFFFFKWTLKFCRHSCVS